MRKITIIIFVILIVGALFSAKKASLSVEMGPVKGFEKMDLKSIAVQQFDTTAIKNSGGDPVELRNRLEYDIIKGLYQAGKIKVIQAYAIKSIDESEVLERSKGDLMVNSTKIIKQVHYDYDPYHKVNSILSGFILKYDQKKIDPTNDYIEISIRIVDAVDGNIYWITRMKGVYKNIVYTIVNTISKKKLTTPAGALTGE